MHLAPQITRETLDSKSKGKPCGRQNKNAAFLHDETQLHNEQYPMNSLRGDCKP
jgi:hypothetical protein